MLIEVSPEEIEVSPIISDVSSDSDKISAIKISDNSFDINFNGLDTYNKEISYVTCNFSNGYFPLIILLSGESGS